MPGHHCVGARVHINLELTDSGSRRVGSPRGVLKGSHEVAMAAWWDCWWADGVPRRVGAGGRSFEEAEAGSGKRAVKFRKAA